MNERTAHGTPRRGGGHHIARAGAVLALVLVTSACSTNQLSAQDREWAQKATLEVARVNDIIGSRFLPAMLGANAKGVVVTPTGNDPDWPAVSSACSSVGQELGAFRQVASTSPKRFAKVGTKLTAYASELSAFVATCHSAAVSRSTAKLDSASKSMTRAGRILAEVAAILPHGIGCPADVPDRPATCDASTS